MEHNPNIYSLLISYANGELDPDNKTLVKTLLRENSDYIDILDDIQHLMHEFGNNWREILNTETLKLQLSTQTIISQQASELSLNEHEFEEMEVGISQKIKESKIAVLEREITRMVENLCTLKDEKEVALHGNEKFIIWKGLKENAGAPPDYFRSTKNALLNLIIISPDNNAQNRPVKTLKPQAENSNFDPSDAQPELYIKKPLFHPQSKNEEYRVQPMLFEDAPIPPETIPYLFNNVFISPCCYRADPKENKTPSNSNAEFSK